MSSSAAACLVAATLLLCLPLCRAQGQHLQPAVSALPAVSVNHIPLSICTQHLSDASRTLFYSSLARASDMSPLLHKNSTAFTSRKLLGTPPPLPAESSSDDYNSPPPPPTPDNQQDERADSASSDPPAATHSSSSREVSTAPAAPVRLRASASPLPPPAGLILGSLFAPPEPDGQQISSEDLGDVISSTTSLIPTVPDSPAAVPTPPTTPVLGEASGPDSPTSSDETLEDLLGPPPSPPTSTQDEDDLYSSTDSPPPPSLPPPNTFPPPYPPPGPLLIPTPPPLDQGAPLYFPPSPPAETPSIFSSPPAPPPLIPGLGPPGRRRSPPQPLLSPPISPTAAALAPPQPTFPRGIAPDVQPGPPPVDHALSPASTSASPGARPVSVADVGFPPPNQPTTEPTTNSGSSTPSRSPTTNLSLSPPSSPAGIRPPTPASSTYPPPAPHVPMSFGTDPQPPPVAADNLTPAGTIDRPTGPVDDLAPGPGLIGATGPLAQAVTQGVQDLTPQPCARSTRPSSRAAYALPVTGGALQSASGSVCGQLDDVPAGLQEVASTWQIDFNGDRNTDLTRGSISSVSCTLGNDATTTSNFTPPAVLGESWQALFRGQTTTVSGTKIGLNIDGEVVNIPVTGFGISAFGPGPAPAPAPGIDGLEGLDAPPFFPIDSETPPPPGGLYGTIGEGRRRRRLLSDADAWSRWLQSSRSASQRPALHRHLQDDTAPTVNVQLTVTRCSGERPVAGASVAALLNGYTAANQSVPLAALAGNVYTGALDFETLFPGIAFSTMSSLQFCDANQANIASACNPGGDTGATFANQSVLLNACSSFLSSGAITQVAQAPQQIVQACSIIAIELALICRSAGGVNCTTAAQQTFTVNVSATVEAIGITPNSQQLPVFGSVFQDTVNGQPGITSLAQTACVA